MNVPRCIRRLFNAPYDGLRNLHVVHEGALYRCGQPTPEQLEELIGRYGLRTVISLRGARDTADPDGWEAAERAVCEHRGVDFITIPCNHRHPPTHEQVGRYLEVMRTPARLPALVHCRIGKQRTGLFCALYRVHIQHVSPEDALREMDEMGFEIRHRRHRRLLETFHRHTASLEAATS